VTKFEGSFDYICIGIAIINATLSTHSSKCFI